ncbi:hypothetical protein [Myxosarcina sp. GI1]|uniref:hypothetical protein n=1 Tax=Myxosarcina sp. GI1 TaxID=1541065 RepID=UPI00056D8BFD|nr:hypothetical protein [Myxosarcina sp. GI1]
MLNDRGDRKIVTISYLPLKAFIGGAIALRAPAKPIADPADVIDARQLFKQAEQNLETVREQKREPIMVTEVITQLFSK